MLVFGPFSDVPIAHQPSAAVFVSLAISERQIRSKDCNWLVRSTMFSFRLTSGSLLEVLRLMLKLLLRGVAGRLPSYSRVF